MSVGAIILIRSMSLHPKTLLGPDEEVSEVDRGGGEGLSWSDRPDEMSCGGDGRNEERGKPFCKTFWFFS